MVAEGDAEDVGGEIFQGGLAGADRLTVDDPVLFPGLRGHLGVEGSFLEGVAELGAEDFAQSLDGHQKSWGVWPGATGPRQRDRRRGRDSGCGDGSGDRGSRFVRRRRGRADHRQSADRGRASAGPRPRCETRGYKSASGGGERVGASGSGKVKVTRKWVTGKSSVLLASQPGGGRHSHTWGSGDFDKSGSCSGTGCMAAVKDLPA